MAVPDPIARPRPPRYQSTDLTGQRFGKLFVVGYCDHIEYREYWVCRCDCGNVKSIIRQSLRRGYSTTCGCGIWAGLQRANITHGKCGTPEYRTWSGMMTRCYNQKERAYQYYGGRGIVVCDRWRGEHGFANFLADMGTKPTREHSLDRICVDKNYSPDNCRWATRNEQANNKRQTIRVTLNGQPMSLLEACRLLGKSYSAVRERMRRGMTFEQATQKPIRYEGGAPTLKDKCREAGMPYHTVYARIFTRGWSEDRALSEPIQNKSAA